MTEYLELPAYCDSLFATACAAPERGLLAALRWARSETYGVPLMLLGWSVAQLSPAAWADLDDRLTADLMVTRPRYGGDPHVWVEGAALANQAEGAMHLPVHAMPEHIVADSYWSNLVLSATHHVRSGDVKVTRPAYEMARAASESQRQGNARVHPLGALSYGGGPRGDDPTVPAWLYGVVLALDPQAARPPRPVKVDLKITSGNSRR